MGGALSGLFAATYPELVTAVTLTCPSSEYFHLTFMLVHFIAGCVSYQYLKRLSCLIPELDGTAL